MPIPADRLAPHHPALATARMVTKLLDKYQLDPLLGLLVPGVGDIVTGAAGLLLIGTAMHLKAPRALIARMLLNLALDVALGAIPIVGDTFDFVYRANARNLTLLEQHLETPSVRHVAGDWLIVGLALGALIAALGVPLLVMVWALRRWG